MKDLKTDIGVASDLRDSAGIVLGALANQLNRMANALEDGEYGDVCIRDTMDAGRAAQAAVDAAANLNRCRFLLVSIDASLIRSSCEEARDEAES